MSNVQKETTEPNQDDDASLYFQVGSWRINKREKRIEHKHYKNSHNPSVWRVVTSICRCGAKTPDQLAMMVQLMKSKL